MKRTERKGQGAMEYLMTYGWAILVVMIVGVVLWQLGIFGGGPGAVNTASGFGKIKPMEPSIKYTTGGKLTFSIMNGVGQGITKANISSQASGDCPASGVKMVYPMTLSGNGVMGAGEVSAELLNCTTKSAGQSFSTTLEIMYVVTIAGSDVTHKETGTIRGVVE